MSTLDKAFITAYSKDPGLAAFPVDAARPATRSRRPLRKPPSRPAASLASEDPYLNGIWYRMDEPDSASTEPDQDSAVSDAVQARRRRNARRPHVRFREVSPQSEGRVGTSPGAPGRAPARHTSEPVVGEVHADLSEPIDPVASKVQPMLLVPAASELDENRPLTSENDDTSPELGSLATALAVPFTGGWESQVLLFGSPPNALDPQVVETYTESELFPPAPPAAIPSVLRFDPPAASVVGKPHFSSPSVDVVPTETPAAPVAAEPAAAAPVESASSTAVEPEPPAEAVDPAKPEFQPAWEVERFSWPSACDELLASAFDDWGLAVRQLLSHAKRGKKILAVAGLRRGEGRSTLALCLARLAAQIGARVALVDADFENPQLANTLGVGTECDWKLNLADGQPLTEASIICLADSLTLIPLQQPVPFKHVSFRQPAIAGMIKAIAAEFELVIVDAGPIAAPEQARVWGGKACPFDGALLVRDLRRTDAEETAATVANLRKHGVDQVIVLENFASTQPAGGAISP